MLTSDFNSVELFAGAGGLSLGALKHGVKPVRVIEWNKDCRATISANSRPGLAFEEFPKNIGKDIRDCGFRELVGSIDLVTGGPPCQPFSVGGKHKAQTDERDMFPEAIRVVRETKPKAFLFENVRGLTRQKFQSYFDYLLLQMRHPYIDLQKGEKWIDHFSRLQGHHISHADSAKDYRVVAKVLNAADFGVPQQRHRVFFVGFRSDLDVDWNFPIETHSKESLIHDLLNGNYFERNSLKTKDLVIPNHWEQRLSRGMPKQAVTKKPWVSVREALRGLPDPKSNAAKKVKNHSFHPGAKVYKGHTGSYLDMPSKALKAGVHGVPGGENMIRFKGNRVRYFSVRESARIQTFPDDFEFTGSWSEAMRQLGNAVPVRLGEILTESIVSALKGK